MTVLEPLERDLRLAFRSLGRHPGFSLVVTLSLGVAIGGLAAAFSLVDGHLLRPLPFQNGGGVVWVMNSPQPGTLSMGLSDPFYVTLAEAVRERGPRTGLAAVGAVAGTVVNVGGRDDPERVNTERVTPSVFTVAGTAPARGRVLMADDARAGAPPVAVISHGLWTRRLGRDPAALGSTLDVAGMATAVVGVMPEGFKLHGEADLWLPMELSRATVGSASIWSNRLAVLGRLAPGLDAAAAGQRIATVGPLLRRAHPEAPPEQSLGVLDYRAWSAGDVRPGLRLMAGVAALILAIACANLIALTLARNEARTGELTVRWALGPGRLALIRLLLVEAVLLGVLGGLLGAALGRFALATFAARFPGEMGPPVWVFAGAGLRTTLFAVILGVVATVAIAWLPALRATGGRHAPARLRQTRSVSAGRRWVRRGLVVGEVAVATVLLVGTGLLLTSLARLARIDPGFDTENRWVADVTLDTAQGAPAALRFWREVTERLQAAPGVRTAAVGQFVPLDGFSNWRYVTPQQANGSAQADYALVGPGYFAAMGIDLVTGREFRWEDADGAAVIVSHTLAGQAWPGVSPLGKRLSVAGGEPHWREVVGVVDDVRGRALGQPPRPTMYFPPEELPFAGPGTMKIVVVGAASGPHPRTAIRAAIRATDPGVPTDDIRSLEQVVDGSEARRRFVTLLLGIFAGVAITLAAVGLYGLLAFGLSLRRREFGLRLALGAGAERIVATVLAESAALVGVGLVIGLATAASLGRVVSGFLYEVPPTHPATYAWGALVLVAIAALASWRPAAQAAAIPPAEALRDFKLR
jgi:putative ABC transport system permease protein